MENHRNTCSVLARSGRTDPKRVLVVDDDPSVCGVFQAMLGQFGYQVVAETDPHQTLMLLREGDFDVLLLDLVMPGLDGLDLLDEIRRHWSTLPILVVTGYGSAPTTVEAMQRGATDFVTKPVGPAFLDLRIKSACDLEHTRRLANTDGLTGLYNHRYLQERLLEEIDRAGRYGRALSLVMADLDHFKKYNDHFGHPRGDEVLIEVATTLRHLSRASDIVARYGGEEFTLILPETPAADAGILAERARQCVEACGFGSREFRVTLSLGVASFHPGCNRESLIEAADTALYEAKRRGRNQVSIFDPVTGRPTSTLPLLVPQA